MRGGSCGLTVDVGCNGCDGMDKGFGGTVGSGLMFGTRDGGVVLDGTFLVGFVVLVEGNDDGSSGFEF